MRNISITLHLVIVPTIAWIQMLNICKVPIRKELASTGIMMFHFLSIDVYQEVTGHQRRVNITKNLTVKNMLSPVSTVMTTLVTTVMTTLVTIVTRKEKKISPVS